MTVTFYDKTEAMEYTSKKQAEGFSIDICGGGKGDYKYIVTLGRKVKRPGKGSAFSPYIPREEIYTEETNNHMLRRLEESGARKLRTKAEIIKATKKAFAKEGFSKVRVEIKKIGDRDGMSDAEVISEGNKITLAIHPIHQYTTNDNFKETIKHEIGHVKGENENE